MDIHASFAYKNNQGSLEKQSIGLPKKIKIAFPKQRAD
jgi:hypothetical protein